MPLRLEKSRAHRREARIELLGLVVLGAVWCVVTYGGYVKPIFLPSPSALWAAIEDFQHRGWLLPAVGRSLLRVTEALSLVIAAGVPTGLLMGASPGVNAFLRRIVEGGKSIPTTGLVGLVVLWFSINETGKIVFLFLGAIFYMIILVRDAVMSVPEEYRRVARDLGASRWQLIQRVLLPGALPRIWEAVAVCNGIMWTYIILAEFLNSSEEQLGLGYLLFVGSRTQDPGKVFAALAIIALVSSLTDAALRMVRRLFFDW
jgi:ABC-type nitrate/sulfonate/bicarbonate transport system permease component